jgi:hypothetical protein
MGPFGDAQYIPHPWEKEIEEATRKLYQFFMRTLDEKNRKESFFKVLRILLSFDPVQRKEDLMVLAENAISKIENKDCPVKSPYEKQIREIYNFLEKQPTPKVTYEKIFKNVFYCLVENSSIVIIHLWTWDERTIEKSVKIVRKNN